MLTWLMSAFWSRISSCFPCYLYDFRCCINVEPILANTLESNWTGPNQNLNRSNSIAVLSLENQHRNGARYFAETSTFFFVFVLNFEPPSPSLSPQTPRPWPLFLIFSSSVSPVSSLLFGMENRPFEIAILNRISGGVAFCNISTCQLSLSFL